MKIPIMTHQTAMKSHPIPFKTSFHSLDPYRDHRQNRTKTMMSNPSQAKKPACAVPDELMMCEQGFLELLSVKTIGDDHELFGKFIDVLKEAPGAVFPTPKEAVINHFDGKNSASKDLPKAIIIQQAKKVYIEESTKGIVRSLKPDQRFFEKSWETFYKLYLHMKYGQDQRVDMDTFKDLMEDFLFSKYGCLFNRNTDLSASDFSNSGFSHMDDLFNHLEEHIISHTKKLAKKRGKE